MTGSTRNLRSERGYSLLEIMVAVTIVGILSAMTAIQINTLRPGLQADGAMRQVMAQLNAARETAISQRRLVEVTFSDQSGYSWVRMTRHNLPNGTTVLNEVPFEGGVRYGVMPNTADTPDGFGNAQAVSFGAALTVMFNTEGMLVDSGGTPVNGSVFMRIPNQPMSYRAVTVLGSTGRVRGFKWNGGSWQRV